MHYLDFVSLIVFILLVFITGLAFAKSGGKDIKSFFAAGGAVPWWMSSLSLFMGFFSAGTFVVWGSIAYTEGVVSLSIQWTMSLAGFLVGLFIAARWRKTNAFTAAEFITHRLGKRVKRIYTLVFLFISLFTTGAFLYPVAKIVSVATGFDLYSCILILGLISVIYVSVGGLWAVIVTDVLQFIILVSAIIILLPLSFSRVGGVQHFLDRVPEHFYELTSGEYTLGFILAFGFYNFIFLSGNWAYVQRYTSVETPRDARKVGRMFGWLYLISPVLWMLPPMVYRVYDPSLTTLESEGAYLMMCKAALPVGMLGMMLGGMVFATASSLNSAINISSAVFTHDIYHKLFPSKTQKQLIRTARISTIVFGLLAIVVALLIPSMGGIVNVVISIGALTGVPLYLPIVWTLFSKRQNARTTLFVTFTSLLVNILFKFVTPHWGIALNRTEEMILGVMLPVALLILTEIYLILHSAERYTPALFPEENVQASAVPQQRESLQEKVRENNFSLAIIGYAIMATGAIIGVIGLLASSGKYAILPVATLLFCLGLFLLRSSKTQNKK